ELHGGTGYLLAQFVSPRTNKREDEYGGTLSNRQKFPLGGVAKVKAAVGDFPVGYRFLAEEWLPDGLTLTESRQFARALEAAGVAYLSVMGGTYESFFLPEIVALGKVTIEGLRGEQRRTWTIGFDGWETDVRPNFAGRSLAAYKEGIDLVKTNKVAEAAAHWRQIAVETGGVGPVWLKPWLFFHQASLLDDARQWKDADSAFQHALQACSEVNSVMAMQILRRRGTALTVRGDWERAEKSFEQAVIEGRKLPGANLTVAQSLDELSAIRGVQGDLSGKERYCHEALAIQEERAPGSRYVAWGLNCLGIIELRRGNFVKAAEYYHQALAILETVAPGSGGIASLLINLGDIANDRGEPVRAAEYFQQALTIARRTPGGEYRAAACLHNLGNAERARGDVVQAEKYLREALEAKEKLGRDSVFSTTTLVSLGELLWERGDLNEAEILFRRAMVILQKSAPVSLTMGDPLQDMGELLDQRGDEDQAEKYFREAIAIREQLVPGSTEHAESLASLAMLLRKKGRPDEASKLFAQAIDALEGQTARLGGADEVRAGFRARHARYYKDYIELLMQQGQPEVAFHVLERSRARTLLETLAAGHVDVRQGVDASLLAQEQLLRAEIADKSSRRIAALSRKRAEQVAALEPEIASLAAKYREVDGEIRRTSPAYAAITQPRLLTAADVQRLLDGQTLLLEYSLGEQRSYVWAITPESVKTYELPGRAEIESQARRVYELLTARKRLAKGERALQREARLVKVRDEFWKAAGVLAHMVLGPVSRELKASRLVIVSDGALQYIPFAALPALSPSTPSGRRAPLAIGHEIVNLPSASTLGELRQAAPGRRHAPRSVAVLADPVFSDQDTRVTKGAQASASTTRDESLAAEHLTRSLADMNQNRTAPSLSRLPFSREEAKAIMAVTPPGQGMEALDFQASRATATSSALAGYRIVHFATHGLLDSSNPEFSGLVFSMVDEHGARQNGFFGLEDIYNLRLSADLVVLSACETGLGKQVEGEGLMGLTRGLMYAGTPEVVASLWNVEDVATAELMKRFYRGMLVEGLTPPAALRKAQIQMSKQGRWADPYYWAGFVVQGDWKGLR
ncbi:MAG: CHAT domain-containing protein, partial [Acidobacteriia bacterium]|nr:CHAT domain-containing protein [Terriglobia bacterium]